MKNTSEPNEGKQRQWVTLDEADLVLAVIVYLSEQMGVPAVPPPNKPAADLVDAFEQAAYETGNENMIMTVGMACDIARIAMNWLQQATKDHPDALRKIQHPLQPTEH